MRQAKICPDSSLACPALIIVCQNNLYNLYINEKQKKFLGKKHRITKTKQTFLEHKIQEKLNNSTVVRTKTFLKTFFPNLKNV